VLLAFVSDKFVTVVASSAGSVKGSTSAIVVAAANDDDDDDVNVILVTSEFVNVVGLVATGVFSVVCETVALGLVERRVGESALSVRLQMHSDDVPVQKHEKGMSRPSVELTHGVFTGTNAFLHGSHKTTASQGACAVHVFAQLTSACPRTAFKFIEMQRITNDKPIIVSLGERVFF
jgi:hypothetical protein